MPLYPGSKNYMSMETTNPTITATALGRKYTAN